MDGCIDGLAFGKGAGHLIAIADAFDVAFAAHDGRNISMLAGFGFRLFHIIFDAREFFEIGFDIGARLAAANADIFRKAKGGDTVDNPEINRFRIAADFRRHLRQRHAEHLTGRERMNIHAIRKGLFHRREVCNMREKPQLNLRVIRRDQDMTRFRDKRIADFTAHLCADRNVLQVRVG